MVAPPPAGPGAEDVAGVLAAALLLADALDAVEGLAVVAAGDAASAWVSVATGTCVGVVDVAFDFVVGLHAAVDKATTTMAAAADTALTCMAAPLSIPANVSTLGRLHGSGIGANPRSGRTPRGGRYAGGAPAPPATPLLGDRDVRVGAAAWRVIPAI